MDAFDDIVAFGHLDHGGVGKQLHEDIGGATIGSLSLMEVEGLPLAVGVADMFFHHGPGVIGIESLALCSRIR